MSRAIAAARPSIKSAVAAGRQPTPQSTKQTRPMADCRSASIKALPRRRPASIIPPLRRLVSPRLTRRSHPDCRAIQTALKPTSKTLELHGVFIQGKGLKYVIADSAFERMKVGARVCRLDARAHHR